MPDIEELMARAACETVEAQYPTEMSQDWCEDAWPNYVPQIRAAIEVLADAGLVIVPREPTKGMMDTAFEDTKELGLSDEVIITIYHAMINAAPGKKPHA